jgi:hypothetical protein
MLFTSPPSRFPLTFLLSTPLRTHYTCANRRVKGRKGRLKFLSANAEDRRDPTCPAALVQSRNASEFSRGHRATRQTPWFSHRFAAAIQRLRGIRSRPRFRARQPSNRSWTLRTSVGLTSNVAWAKIHPPCRLDQAARGGYPSRGCEVMRACRKDTIITSSPLTVARLRISRKRSNREAALLATESPQCWRPRRPRRRSCISC